jgi:hypothetical protein
MLDFLFKKKEETKTDYSGELSPMDKYIGCSIIWEKEKDLVLKRYNIMDKIEDTINLSNYSQNPRGNRYKMRTPPIIHEIDWPYFLKMYKFNLKTWEIKFSNYSNINNYSVIMKTINTKNILTTDGFNSTERMSVNRIIFIENLVAFLKFAENRVK